MAGKSFSHQSGYADSAPDPIYTPSLVSELESISVRPRQTRMQQLGVLLKTSAWIASVAATASGQPWAPVAVAVATEALPLLEEAASAAMAGRIETLDPTDFANRTRRIVELLKQLSDAIDREEEYNE